MKRRSFLRVLCALVFASQLPGLPAFADEFDKLTEAQKLEVKKNYERFKGFSPERQKQVIAAFEKIEKLDPAQRKKLNENYAIWKALSPEEREDVRRRHKSWAAMDDASKQKIRDRLEALDKLPPGEKAKLLNKLRKEETKAAGQAK